MATFAIKSPRDCIYCGNTYLPTSPKQMKCGRCSPTCKVDGCSNPPKTIGGYCKTHQERLRDKGVIHLTDLSVICGTCGSTFAPIHHQQKYCPTCQVTCRMDGCAKAAKSAGYCSMHLTRFRQTGSPDGAIKPVGNGVTCSVSGCHKAAVRRTGHCDSHYRRFKASGDAGDPTFRKRGLPKGTPCKVDGCTRFNVGNGLCTMHKNRMARTGQLGPAHSTQKPRDGTPFINAHGYPCIWRDGKQVLVHRKVMEEHLGRPLSKAENVHHLNGQRTDFRLENLELWNTSQPCGQRPVDKIAFAIEIIGQYPELLEAAGFRLVKIE